MNEHTSKFLSLRDINVRVLPKRYVREYTGTTSIKKREVPVCDWGVVMSFDDAIRKRFDTSAHFQTMQVPGFETTHDTYPRVGRTWAYNLWRDDIPQAALPHFDVLVLDLDHGSKVPWHERKVEGADDKAFAALIDSLRNEYGFAYYMSRTGARLVGRLQRPLTTDVYEDYLSRFLVHLNASGYPVFTPDVHGHHIDASCFDLGRLFKLPLVPDSRPDEGLLGSAWYEPTFKGDVEFDPGALLPWTFGRRKGGIGRATTPPPEKPRKFNKSDLKALRRFDFFDTITRPISIGRPGSRHEPIIVMSGTVAKVLNLTDPEQLYGIMYPCVSASVVSSDRASDVYAELWQIAHYVTAGIEARVEAAEESAKVQGLVRRGAFARIVEITGCSTNEAANKIILATNTNVYYVFDEDADAYSPAAYKLQQLGQALAKHCPNLVQLRTENGGYVADRTLALKYGSADVSEVRYVYASKEVRLDLDARVLYLPTCNVRPDLVPKHHDRVARWFECLGGTKHHEDLLNWMARYPDLEKPLCALYLRGEKGNGKGVLARALASVFGAEPVSYEILGKQFQKPRLTSPLLFADESIQLGQFRSGHGTSILRSTIGNGSRPIEKKGLDEVQLIGFCRVFIGANNDNALQIKEDLSRADVAAIQERVGYIRIPDGPASAFISSLSWDEIDNMIRREVPEHILYLAQTRKPASKRSRFASWRSSFARTVKLNIGDTQVVAEVLGRWFGRLSRNTDPNGGLFVNKGKLYVRTTLLTQVWPTIMSTANRLPTSAAIRTALKALAHEDDEKPNSSVRVAGEVIRAWCIDPSKIAAVLDELDADADGFRSVFDLKTEAKLTVEPVNNMKKAMSDYWAVETLQGKK